jgi:exosortase A-associated hydrolase 2
VQAAARPQVFFLPAPGGEQRLGVFHAAAGPTRGRVLYLHPFAEEMNKSRRMAALGSRALAAAGFSVLQLDLRGCGDSSADFGETGWQDWLADVALALDWLDAEAGDAPLWLWGLRAGCLLAVEAATALRRPCNFLFWQPTPSGRLVLQQFLRLRLAAEMAGGGAKGLMDTLKTDLAAGRTVEVAGYSLRPELSRGLETAQLTPPAPVPAGRVAWWELGADDAASFSPVSAQAQQGWRDAGWQVDAAIVGGPNFWATTEIELAPALVQRCTEAL